MITNIGQQALLGIVIHLICFALTWWALQSLNFDKMLRAGRVMQARVLYILLTIAIGSAVAGFLLNYLFWSNQLPYL
ncbi:DUF1146 family protein [Peribacillus kribbensis]|uniref:DUF1146 family protein n=1 Tax=Peribacillus kribbensis TaxID=356658 RepID=UPI0004052189|nr:DUF1146 family protein [Peribacillus kribbensis]